MLRLSHTAIEAIGMLMDQIIIKL